MCDKIKKTTADKAVSYTPLDVYKRQGLKQTTYYKLLKEYKNSL